MRNKSTKTLATNVNSGMWLVPELIANDRYKEAVDAATALKGGCQKARMPKFLVLAANHEKRAKSLLKDFSRIGVKTNDPNVEVNEAKSAQLGKFYCFNVADWGRGIPWLLKSKDTLLVRLAKMETATLKTAETYAQLGDGWAAYARSLSRLQRAPAEQRARHWYTIAYRTHRSNGSSLVRQTIARKLEDLPAPTAAIYVRGVMDDTDTFTIYSDRATWSRQL
ncbi:MAG: hypothetical protein CMJ78_04405 [Planctomycetaceae bacterium]|nr:hypothetical protein [Planctomycetaceae bacterium]